jgi:hypothetical protein
VTSVVDPAVVLWHFGHLSPWEQVLVYALGLGPFVLLAVVVAVVRRHEGPNDGPAGRDGS